MPELNVKNYMLKVCTLRPMTPSCPLGCFYPHHVPFFNCNPFRDLSQLAGKSGTRRFQHFHPHLSPGGRERRGRAQWIRLVVLLALQLSGLGQRKFGKTRLHLIVIEQRTTSKFQLTMCYWKRGSSNI